MALEDTRPQIGLFDKAPGPDTTSTPSGDSVNSKEKRRRERESKGLLRTTKRKQKIRGQLPDETAPTDINEAGRLDTVPLEQQFNLQSLNLTSSIPALSLRGPEVDAVTGPVKPPKEDGWGVKTLDFLFGMEAAVIGIQHDSEGWSWSVENMKQQSGPIA